MPDTSLPHLHRSERPDALDAAHARLGIGPALDEYEPSYTGDEPLGTCVVHGDYWTDDCLRCGR